MPYKPPSRIDDDDESSPPPPAKKTGAHHGPDAAETAQIDALLRSSLTNSAIDFGAKATGDVKPADKKKLAWKNELFVVKTLSSRDDSFRPRRRSILLQQEKRPSMRIEDPEKLDTRWNWYQELISNTFNPYEKMLSEHDDLLPTMDESFAEPEENEHHVKVRNAMLDDGELSEREIAAFFEGFSFLNIKVKSLSSQLASLTAIQETERTAMKSFRDATATSRSFVNTSTTTTTLFARKRPVSKVAPSTTDGGNTAFKSLRAMSIRKVQSENKDDKDIQKLLQELEEADKKQKKLEKQLQQAGIKLAEDIPYHEAKAQVQKIAKRMAELGTSEGKEYFQLEQDMERYHTALTLSDEWIEEQEEIARKWEEDNADGNIEALKMLRRHMPVNVKSVSESQLASDETPNGRILPKNIAKRFKRTNVLQLLRVNPEDLVKIHPATVENLRVAGLTLTERRAIHAHLKDVAPRWKAMSADQMTERKWNWYKVMKTNFQENLDSYNRHVTQYGPPCSHPYATRDNPKEGCPLLGRQCPLKVDKMIDYSGDYGYTEESEYEESNVRKADKEDSGAKAMREAMELTREKKSNARGDTVKQHYKGNILQVSLAIGGCENMDETLDRIEYLLRKWLEERLSNIDASDASRRKELSAFSDAMNDLKLSLLSFAERSGMQLTGKKDANADQPDIRSPTELGLSEEVCEACIDLFEDIVDRMRAIDAKDGRLKSTVNQLRELLDELHERNVATLLKLNVERPERSRKRLTPTDIKREIRKSLRAKAVEKPTAQVSETRFPPAGRGGLMNAIAGRGGGRGGAQGDLMSAIAGRGGGGRGRGQGNLMAAIAGRGKGPPGGGRGDMMAAIAGRGRGGS